MTTETKQPTLTPEEQVQADAEAFTGGFTSVREADPSLEDEPAKPETRQPAESQAGGEMLEEGPLFAGYTEKQLKALLAKSAQVDALEQAIQKAHGKIGEMNRTLQEFQQRQTQPAAQAAGEEELSEDNFGYEYKDIAKLADIRARKIVEESMKGREGADPEQLVTQVSARVEKQMEENFMGFLHSDWRDVIGSDDYKVWLATQPEEIRERATTTPRATELAEVLGSYKSAKGAQTSQVQRSRERLAAGLTPKGVQGQVPVGPTEQDEFRAGFKSVRGN